MTPLPLVAVLLVAPQDPLDAIKSVPIAEDVRLSFGGELRLRGEGWSDFAFSPANDDVFLLGRALVNADLRVGESFRAFAEGKVALLVDERDLPGGSRTLDVDYPELQQGYVELVLMRDEAGDRSLAVRGGRQELLFGRQRLVSPLPWSNSMRSWDGGRVTFRSGGWTIDGFLTRYAAIDKYEFNDWATGPTFWGVYATGPLGDGLPTLDGYYLGIDGAEGNFNGSRGDETRHTFGARLSGSVGGFGYDVEGAYRFGEVGSADVSAYMFGGEVSYRFAEGPWAPKAWVGFDLGSGDRTAGDDEVQTFNQLFPSGHAFLGGMDFVGRQNILSPNVGVQAKPLEALTLTLSYNVFWRYDDADALYNAGGSVVRGPGGSGSRFVGSEIDLVARYAIDKRTTLEGGYSHFFPGSFLEDTGPSSSMDWVYLQLSYRF